MKMKLAKWRNVRVGYEVVTDEWCDGHNDYIRLSEFVEVDFPALSVDAVIAQEVAVLDKKIDDIQTRALVEMTQLRQRKQELLALTSEVTV